MNVFNTWKNVHFIYSFIVILLQETEIDCGFNVINK